MTIIDQVVFILMLLAYPTTFMLWFFWRESNKAIKRHNAQPTEVWIRPEPSRLTDVNE